MNFSPMKTIVLLLFFLWGNTQKSFGAQNAQTPNAEISPKVKVVATMALYGVVGGALLGTASMAYGNTSRAIFQGASLGLYAGILFGSYVVISYKMRKERREREENDGPEYNGRNYRYKSDGPYGDDPLQGSKTPTFDSLRGNLFASNNMSQYSLRSSAFKGDLKLFQVNFLQLSF